MNGPCARNYDYDIIRLNEMVKCTIKRSTNINPICYKYIRSLFISVAFAILSVAFVQLRAIACIPLAIHGSPVCRLQIGNTEGYNVRARTFYALLTDVYRMY